MEHASPWIGSSVEFGCLVPFCALHDASTGEQADVHRYKLHCAQESSMGVFVFVFAFGFVVVWVRVRVRIWLRVRVRVRVRASANCIVRVRVRVRQTYVLFGALFGT